MQALQTIHENLLLHAPGKITRLQWLEVLTEGDARKDAEGFIRDAFAREHQAEIVEFLPWLLVLRRAGTLEAVLGMRPADRQPLFLEQYLDQPIETLLPDQPERRHLLEIGNLAGHGRHTITLFLMLVALCHRLDIRHVVFTATPIVRKLLERSGFIVTALQAADPNRLGDERHRWGHYYDQVPTVMAGDIERSLQQLQQRPQSARQLALFAGDIDAMADQLEASRWS